MVKKKVKKSVSKVKPIKVKHTRAKPVRMIKGKNKVESKNDKKLDTVIALEKKLLKEEKRIEGAEKRIESDENSEHAEENKVEQVLEKEESDLQKLEQIEQDIKAQVGDHPLAKVTFKDITKGMIGAFIGLAIHYTFTYGVEIAEGLSMARATILFPVTFVVGLLFIYATGFRKVTDKKLLIYMPLRLLVLYVCALAMSVLILLLFYQNFGHSFEESYKMVAGVMLAAVVGACTADLIGKD